MSAERWTIPAACLEQLGGLQNGDPPVRLESESENSDWCEDSDTLTVWPDDARPVLPSSGPALLRALARYVGLGTTPGEALYLYQHAHGHWVLRSGPQSVAFDHTPDRLIGAPSYRIPALADVTDPTQALAEVVVWLARLERMRATRPPVGWPDDATDAEILASFEATEDSLPVWSVTRG